MGNGCKERQKGAVEGAGKSNQRQEKKQIPHPQEPRARDDTHREWWGGSAGES